MSTHLTDVVIRTVVLTDVVDSTQLTRELGDARTAELFARIDRVARDLLAVHGGQEIDKTDGFLHLFKLPLDAVRYTLALHTSLLELSASMEIDVAVRAGIHLGEVTLRQNTAEDIALGAKPVEIDGLTKPVAARIMSLARGGQTLMSRAAFDVARRASVGHSEQTSLSWASHGHYAVKGLDARIEICEVLDAAATAVAPRRAAPSSRPAPFAPSARPAPSRPSWLPRLAGGMAVVGLAGASMVIAWWGSNRAPADEVTVEWFAETTERNGVVRGSSPVTGPEGRRRTLRQESRNGRIEALSMVNSAGKPLPFQYRDIGEEGPMEFLRNGVPGDLTVGTIGPSPGSDFGHRLEYAYDASGRVESAVERDTHGRVQRRSHFQWTDDGYVRSTTDAFGVPTSGEHLLGPSEVARVSVRDGYAVDKVLRRATGDHDPRLYGATGGSGVYSTRATWDEVGNQTSNTYLDAHGVPVQTEGGCVSEQMQYDEQRRLIRLSCHGHGGIPVRMGIGCSSQAYGYDERGNRSRKGCFGPDGELTPNVNFGCNTLAVSTLADRVETRCESEPGTLMVSSYGWARTVLWLDDNGYAERRERFGVDGKPAGSPWGISTSSFVVDDTGTLLEVGPHTDVRGRSVSPSQACATWTARYEDGLEQERTCLDEEGKPRTNIDGWAIRTIAWDEADNPARMTYRDPDGEPVVHPTAGHVLVREHDERGQVTRAQTLGPTLEPLSIKGVAEMRYEYDAHGRETASIVLDAKGLPAVEPEGASHDASPGCHRFESHFDGERRLRTERCLGIDGEPTLTQNNWAIRRTRFDEVGRMVEVSYADTDDEPVMTRHGVVTQRFAYDDHGRMIRKAFFDGKGLPTVNPLYGNYSSEESVYDDRGNPVTTLRFGPLGRPRSPHWSRREMTYDDAGRRISIHRYGADGQLDADSPPPGEDYADGEAGWSQIYGAQGRIVEVRILYPDGQTSIYRLTYDASGRRLSRSFFDGDGRARYDAESGCSREEFDYDKLGRAVVVRVFDAQGSPGTEARPPVVKYAFHPVTNQAVRVEHLDADGHPVDGWGPALTVITLDDRGFEHATAYRDASGQPVASPNGASDVTKTWDVDRRLLLGKRLLAPDGSLIEEVVYEYDASDRLVRSFWRDGTGAPTTGPEGCKEVTITYGDGGRVEKQCDGRVRSAP